MDEAQALEIRKIELPGSVLKVLRFLEDFRRWGEDGNDLASVALASARFSKGIAGRHDLGSRVSQRSLMARYGLTGPEIRDFVFWIRRAVAQEGARVRSSRGLVSADAAEFPIQRAGRRHRPPPVAEGEVPESRGPSGRFLSLRRRSRADSRTLERRGEVLGESEVPTDVGTEAFPARRVGLAGAMGAGSLALGAWVAGRWVGPSRPDGAWSNEPSFAEDGERLRLRSRPPLVDIDRVPIGRTSSEAFATSQRDSRRPLRHTIGGGDPLAEAVLQHRMAGYPRVPTRDLLSGGSGVANSVPRPLASRKPSALPFSPLLGQVTLVAPPIRVASPDRNGKTGAMAFDLPSLKKGIDRLTPSSLQALKEILPPGAQALYPAVPLDMAGPSAVNVPLAPETISLLMKQGYGRAEAGWAESVASLAFSTPPVTALAGKLSPSAPTTSGPGSEPSARGHSRIIDLLGLPVRLAPRPDASHDLPHRQVARLDLRSTPTTPIRPNIFAMSQRKAFPHFHTVNAAPILAASRPMVNPSPPLGSRFTIPTPSLGFVTSPTPMASSLATSSMPSPIPTREPSTPVRAPLGTRSSPATMSAPGIGARPSMPTGASAGSMFSAPSSIPNVPPPMAPQAYPMPDMPEPTRPSFELPRSMPAKEDASSAPSRMMSTARLSLESHPMASVKPASTLISSVRAPMASAAPRPAMPLAELRKARPEEDDLAIQMSRGEAATPAARGGGAKTVGGAAGGGAAKDAEIGLLANEVWSLLKRRLAFEAQRAGQR